MYKRMSIRIVEELAKKLNEIAKKRAKEAEQRALIHFRKLNKIERILTIEKTRKTPAVIILDKIEEVIVGQNK